MFKILHISRCPQYTMTRTSAAEGVTVQHACGLWHLSPLPRPRGPVSPPCGGGGGQVVVDPLVVVVHGYRQNLLSILLADHIAV